MPRQMPGTMGTNLAQVVVGCAEGGDGAHGGESDEVQATLGRREETAVAGGNGTVRAGPQRCG